MTNNCVISLDVIYLSLILFNILYDNNYKISAYIIVYTTYKNNKC